MSSASPGGAMPVILLGRDEAGPPGNGWSAAIDCVSPTNSHAIRSISDG